MSGRSDWTPAGTSLLCELRGSGVVFSKVATLLGRPRNAVIGKFNRLLAETTWMKDHDLTRMMEMVSLEASFDEIAQWFAMPVETIEARFAAVRLELGPQAI